jgi:hypothetical protein
MGELLKLEWIAMNRVEQLKTSLQQLSESNRSKASSHIRSQHCYIIFIMIFIIIFAAVIFLAGLAYAIGLFDRPKFEYRDYLLKSKREPLFVLAAPCQEPSFPKHIPRIIQGTLDAIQTLKDSTKLLAEGAALYDVPDGAERLCVGLYFDDPWTTNTPRWSIGWAVGCKDFGAAQALAVEANKNKPAKLKEPIVAIRVGPSAGVGGRIKWRTPITPMIMPMIMWSRAFSAYEKGGYKSNNGREGDEGSIACEIYVTGPKDSSCYIDYIVLSGDTKNTWDDAFPIAKN